jgi:hypothetical protein
MSGVSGDNWVGPIYDCSDLTNAVEVDNLRFSFPVPPPPTKALDKSVKTAVFDRKPDGEPAYRYVFGKSGKGSFTFPSASS